MTERRYREDEVRRILELATQPGADERTTAAADGLTLAEIQSVAGEVGVAPDVVARAASRLDARAAEGRTSWGMPIEVGRSVTLPADLTDAEWNRLVSELRTTFRARGRVVSQGGFREWSNGNLHACVEPTEHGHRLRLGTLKGDAAPVNALGATGIVAGAVVFGASALSGGLADGLFAPMVLSASGVGALLANLLRLPRWADERRRQMEHIEAMVLGMIATRPDHDPPDE